MFISLIFFFSAQIYRYLKRIDIRIKEIEQVVQPDPYNEADLFLVLQGSHDSQGV